MRLTFMSLWLMLAVSINSVYSQGDWKLLSPSPTSNQIQGMYFIDGQTGWAVGEYGVILKSIDGGVTWTIKEIPWLFDLADIHFPTEQTGYAIGTDGLIIKSTDGGEHWTQQENFYSNNLNRVLFLDELNGWTIGEKGLILHTADGGSHWEKQTSSSMDNLLGIDFIGTEKVCVVGENQSILLYAGTHNVWSRINFTTTDRDTPFFFEDVFFIDDMNGWICGYDQDENGVILFTTDGGIHWQRRVTGGVGVISYLGFSSIGLNALHQIYFYDNLKTGLTLTKTTNNHKWANILLKTTNNGYNWKGLSESNDAGNLASDGCFSVLSGNRIVVTGGQGDFRYSDDNGRTCKLPHRDRRWWQALIPGNNGQLLAFQHYYQRDVTSVSSPDDRERNRMLAFYRSIDYGTTWQEYTPQFNNVTATVSPDNIFLFNSYLLNRDTLWTVIEDTSYSESIFFSTDFGQTYHEVQNDINSGEYLGETCFVSPDTLIRFRLMRSEESPNDYKSILSFAYSFNGGKTFEQAENSDVWNDITSSGLTYKAVNDYHFFNGHTGFLVGTEGNIIKTTDAGKTWANIYSGVVEDLWAIEFLDNQTGFVVGDFGRILKTEDGGDTWRKTDSGTQENIYAISFMNDHEGWVGTETGLRNTTDVGETWYGVPLRYNRGPVREITFDNKNNGYAYTINWQSDNYAHLLRMKNSLIGIDRDNPASRQPRTITLSQNYPNPFNALTRIDYYLPNSGSVSIKIINLQGQVVCTLVNESKNSGHYSATWDGRSDAGIPVSSGIYFYQLHCNGTPKNQKLLLLK
ncbi:T9SS type A sorting domain-containing protein [candidate division KSB1 bacterium]|nr:T9SS type A sorting domain-containing protein [candidate division KSB1 bacterium]